MLRGRTAFSAASALLIVLIAFASTPRFANAEEASLPTSPKDVRPILIGAAIPDVTVADLDGASILLGEITRGKPTVLIFYRGGW